MLVELRVANFALIDQLHLDIPGGFVALTGETGAGKSLLVDALALLLGRRATTDQIRTGAEEAELEAVFELAADGSLAASLRDRDLMGGAEAQVVLRRILSRTARGRSYINGRPVALHELEQFAGVLVDIHGQHEQQSLLSASSQLTALDRFGDLMEYRARYQRAYAAWSEAKRRYDEAVVEADLLQQRGDLLRYQSEELREAAVQPGEDEQLLLQSTRLAQADRLRAASEQAYGLLYADEGAVLERLGLVSRHLREIAAVDPSSAAWDGPLEQAVVLLQELAAGLRGYRDEIQDDPGQLAEVEARLGKLEALKKKYGGSVAAVISKGQELQERVRHLEQSQEHLEALHQEMERSLKEAGRLAADLSARRRRTTAKLEQALEKELRALHLPQARLAVQVETAESADALTASGQDRVQFMFSGNAGEALYPLARVASGGECSRVMLALKTVLASSDTVPVLIFDEIDAGVGGAVATAIGARLRAVARYHQVLCVTHAPQVAAKAQAHIEVHKSMQDKRTVTSARQLTPADRQEAIARMLGGKVVTATMRRAAAELLAAGETP